MDPPDDKKKKKKWDDDDEDEGSEVLSIRPRNLSYSLQSARALKSPAKRKKKPAWPPRGEDDEEEEGKDNGDEDDDDDDTGSRHTRGTKCPSIMPTSMNGSTNGPRSMASRRLLPSWECSAPDASMAHGAMDEWLTGIEDANVPHA